MIETITPESLGRPITAEDVQEGDTIHTLRVFDWQISADGELWVGEIDLVLLDDWINVRGVVIASITRPVVEQPALPTEPNYPISLRGVNALPKSSEPGGGVTWVVNVYEGGDWAWLMNKYGTDFTPLVPAGSERETALREAAALVENLLDGEKVPTEWDDWYESRTVEAIPAAILALVPEAEGEKA